MAKLGITSTLLFGQTVVKLIVWEEAEDQLPKNRFHPMA